MKDLNHSISAPSVDLNLKSNAEQLHRAGVSEATTCKSMKETSETGHEGAGSNVLHYLKTVLQAKLRGNGPSQPAVSPGTSAESIDLRDIGSLSPSPEGSSEAAPMCYRCASCHRKFMSLSMLDIHKRVYHWDEGKTEGEYAEESDLGVGVCCIRCRQVFFEIGVMNEHECSRFVRNVPSADSGRGVKSDVASDSMHSSVEYEECSSVPLQDGQRHRHATMDYHSSNAKQANCDELFLEVKETTSLCMDHEAPILTSEEKATQVCASTHCGHVINSNMTDAEFSTHFVEDGEVTFQTSDDMKLGAVGVASFNQAASDLSSSTDISLICGPCGQHFPSTEDMMLHKCSRRCETEFPCSVCESKFKLFRSFRLHMKSVHHIESFQCSHCSSVFLSEEDLAAHPCQVNNRRPHLCDICGKCYKTAGYLVTHKLSHYGIRPHKCVVCGKGFTQPSNLQTHMRIHRGERPFACKVCGKSFRQLDHLMKHAGVHTKDAPYACETCGKRFRDEDYVKKHMRIHTGAMPFECKDCGLKFRWANRFAAHKCKPDSSSDGVSASGEGTAMVELTESQTSDSSLRAGHTSEDGSLESGSGAELGLKPTVIKKATKSDSKVPVERRAMHKNRKSNPPIQKEGCPPDLARERPTETECYVGSLCKSKQMCLQQAAVDAEEQGDLSKTFKSNSAVDGSVCNGAVAGRSIRGEQSEIDSDDDQGRLQIVEDDDKEDSRSDKINGDDWSCEGEVAERSCSKNAAGCSESPRPRGKQSHLLAQMLMSKSNSVVALCPDEDTEVDSSITDAEVKFCVASGVNNSAGETAASMHVRELPGVEGGGEEDQVEVNSLCPPQDPDSAPAAPSLPNTSAAPSEPSPKRGMERGVFTFTGDACTSGDRSLSLPLPLGVVCSMHDDQSFIDSLTSDLVKKYINLPPSPPRGTARPGFVNALTSIDLPLSEGVAVEEPFPPLPPNSVPPKDLPAPVDWPPIASSAAVPPSSVGPVVSDSSQTTLTVASVTSLSVSEFERMPISACAPTPAPVPKNSKSTVIQKGSSFEGPIPFTAHNSDVYTISNDGSNRLHQTVKAVKSHAGNVPHPLPSAPHPTALSDRQTAAPAFLANPSASHTSQNIRPETSAMNVTVKRPEIARPHLPQSSRHIPPAQAGIAIERRDRPLAAVYQDRPILVSKSEILSRLHHPSPVPSHSLSLHAYKSRKPPPYPGSSSCSHVREITSALRLPMESRPALGSVSARVTCNIPAGAVASCPSLHPMSPQQPGNEENHSRTHSARPPAAHRPAASDGKLGRPNLHVPAVASSPAEEPMDLSVPRNRLVPESAAAERRGRDIMCVSRRSSREQREGSAGVTESAETSVAEPMVPNTSLASVTGSGAVNGAIQGRSSSSDLIRKPSSAISMTSGLADSNLPLPKSRHLPLADCARLRVPDSPSAVATNPIAGDGLTTVMPVSAGDDKQTDSAINKNLVANLIRRPGQPAMMQCVLCGSEFRWRPYKSTQKCIQCCRKTCRSIGKSHICDICGKVFTQSGNLRTHLRLHAGDKPYECHICQKRFALMKYLNSHVRMHSAEKNFECHVCGKKLRDATYIKHHMRVHTGAKPFKCRSCSKAFRWRSEFRSHRCSSSNLLSEKRGLGAKASNQETENDRMLTIAMLNGAQTDGFLRPSKDGGCLDVRSEVVLGSPGKEMVFSKLRYRKPLAERRRDVRTSREPPKSVTVNSQVVRSQTVTVPEVSVDKASPTKDSKASTLAASGQSDPPNSDELTFEAAAATEGKQMAFGLVRIVDEQKGLAEVVWTSSGSTFAQGLRSEPVPDGNMSGDVVETYAPQAASAVRTADLPTDVLLLQNDYIYGSQNEECGEDEIKTEPMEESEHQSMTTSPEDATSEVRPSEEQCESEMLSAKDFTSGDSVHKDRSDDGYDTFDERRQSDTDERANPPLPACPEKIHAETNGPSAPGTHDMLAPPPSIGLELLSRVCERSEKPGSPAVQAAGRPRISEMPPPVCSDDASGYDLAPLNVMVSNILALRPDIPASTYTTNPPARAPRLASKSPTRASRAVSQPEQLAPQAPCEDGVVWVPMSSLQFPPGTVFVNSSKPCTAVANSQGKFPQTTVSGSRPISHVVAPSESVLSCGTEVPGKVSKEDPEKVPENICQEASSIRDVGKHLRLKLKRKSSDRESNENWEVEAKDSRKEGDDTPVQDRAVCKQGTGDKELVTEGSKDVRGSALSGSFECRLPCAAASPTHVSSEETLLARKGVLDLGENSGNVADGAENQSLLLAKRGNKCTRTVATSRKRRKRSRFRKYRGKRGDNVKGNDKLGCHVKKRRRAEGELLMADTKEILSVMKETRRTVEEPSKKVVGRRGRGSLICGVCNMRFMQASRLEVHMLEHSADDNRRCPECLKVFSKPGNLAQHMLIHADTRPFVCNICKLRFRQRHHLSTHLRAHSDLKNHECHFCHKELRDRWYLKQHLRLHTGEKPFHCPDCGKAFRWKAFLKTHKCGETDDSTKAKLTDSESLDSLRPDSTSTKASGSSKVRVKFRLKSPPNEVTADAPSSSKRRMNTAETTEKRVAKVRKSTKTSRTEKSQSDLTEKRGPLGIACSDQSSGRGESPRTTVANETMAQKPNRLANLSSISVRSPAIAEKPVVTQSADFHSHKETVQMSIAEPMKHSSDRFSESENKAADFEGPLSSGEASSSTSVSVVSFIQPNLGVATAQPHGTLSSVSSQPQASSLTTPARNLPPPRRRSSPRGPRMRKPSVARQELPLGGPPPLIEAQTLYTAQALSRLNQPMDLSLGTPRAASRGQEKMIEGTGATSRMGGLYAIPARPRDHGATAARSTDSFRHHAGRRSPETRMINLADFPVRRLKHQERRQNEHIPESGMESVSSFSSAANVVAMPTYPPRVEVNSSRFSDPNVAVNSRNIPGQVPPGHGFSTEPVNLPLPLLSHAVVSSSSQPLPQSNVPPKRRAFLNPCVTLTGLPAFSAASAMGQNMATEVSNEDPVVLMSNSSLSFVTSGSSSTSRPIVSSAHSQSRSSGNANSSEATSHTVASHEAVPPIAASVYHSQQPFSAIAASSVDARAVVPAHTSNLPARLESAGQHSAMFIGIPVTTGTSDPQNYTPHTCLNSWQGMARAHLNPHPEFSVGSTPGEAELRSAVRGVSEPSSHAHPMPNSAASQDVGSSVARSALRGREASASPGNRESMSSPNSADGDVTYTSASSTVSGHAGREQSPPEGENPQRVLCGKCGKTFPSKLALRRHMRAHSNPAPYRCPDCDKGFHDPELLRAHQPMCSGFNPRKCPTCGRVFSQTGNCKKHMLIHVDARPYECELCKKRFRALYHLQCHMTTHNDDRPYSCDLCGKTFRDGSYIKKHMRLHTGELPYKCEYCSESFRWSSVYAKHLNRVHGRVRGSEEQAPLPSPQN